MDLTSEEVVSIVKNKFGGENCVVIDYKTEAIEEVIGNLGDHAILSVKAKREEREHTELKFFVKFFPTDKWLARFATLIGAFPKEIFVNTLFDRFSSSGIKIIESCTPKCYLSKPDSFLVFEDLSSDAFELVDNRSELNYEELVIVLRYLAKLHGSALVYEEQKSEELGRKFRLGDEYPDDFVDSFYNDSEGFIGKKAYSSGVKGVLGNIDYFGLNQRLLSGKEFEEVAEKCCYDIYALVKPSREHRNVVCHGDAWLSNMMFKKNRKGKIVECKFVDFQAARYCPPAQDVMAVLHLTTSRAVRKNKMYELIGVYYTFLDCHLKAYRYKLEDIIPFEDFLNSCDLYKKFGIVQAATHFQLVILPPEVRENFFKRDKSTEDALLNDRGVLVRTHIEQDGYYRRKLEETVLDLRDYCQYL